MGIISWIVIGLTVGFLASVVLKRRKLHMLSMVLVSITGAVIGGLDVAFLYRVPGAIQEINREALLVALIGALITVALLSLLTPQKSPAV